MRKQSVVLVFIFLLLLTISGQTTLSRLWASGNDNQPTNAAAQTGSPARQPGSMFLTGPAAGDPVDIALTYLRQQATTLGLHTDDLADLVVTDRYVTQHNGITHLYLRQRYHGIAVFNGVVNINISRSGEVINLGNRFVPNLAQAVNTETPALTAPAAVEYAAQGLKLTLTAPIYILEDRNGPAREMQLSTGGIAKTVIPAKLVYQRQADGKLHLAWSLIIEPLADQHRWHLRVDAVNGAILAKEDLILHDSWAPPWSATKHQEQPTVTDAVTDAATGGEQPASPLTPPTYRIFPLPLEHPDDGPSLPDSQAVVNNPADALASPYGWHDIDSQPGHEFSDTRGNNVAAQEDRNDDNADGFRPTGKKPKKFNFDYPFDPTHNPIEGNNASAPPLPQARLGQPTMPTAVSYAGERLNAHSASVTVPKHAGLTGSLTLDAQGNPNVLLLAAGDVLQIQALLATYADLGQIDIYDAHLDTPTLAQLAAYDTNIVIANNGWQWQRHSRRHCVQPAGGCNRQRASR